MLGVDARDPEAAADILYRIANQVDCRDKDRELCRIQYAAREEAHRNTDATTHAHDCRDEHGCSFSGQSPECHDWSADHADDVQEARDIENADDDESHDDIRQQARRANRKAIARTVDEEVKDIFLFAVSGVAICIPSSRIFPVEHLQVHAHQIAADDLEDEHDDDWHDDWCDHVTEYGCAR